MVHLQFSHFFVLIPLSAVLFMLCPFNKKARNRYPRVHISNLTKLISHIYTCYVLYWQSWSDPKENKKQTVSLSEQFASSLKKIAFVEEEEEEADALIALNGIYSYKAYKAVSMCDLLSLN